MVIVTYDYSTYIYDNRETNMTHIDNNKTTMTTSKVLPRI